MPKKSDLVVVRVVQICSILLWVGLLLIFNFLVKAQPPQKGFFEYFFKVNPRSYLDSAMVNKAMILCFIQLFASIILLFVNANYHKKKLLPVSFSIVFSIIVCLIVIIYYILVF